MDLTEWQQNFVRVAIDEAIMSKQDEVYVEIDKFKDEFEKAYPSGGKNE